MFVVFFESLGIVYVDAFSIPFGGVSALNLNLVFKVLGFP